MAGDFQHSAATSKYRVPFTPRTYPGLRFVIVMLYLTAGLSVVSGVVLCASLMTADKTPVPGSPLMALAGVIGSHLFAMVFSVASAESIRVWIDIQLNTQETAHYAKIDHLARSA